MLNIGRTILLGVITTDVVFIVAIIALFKNWNK